jgi:hypothetical protein
MMEAITQQSVSEPQMSDTLLIQREHLQALLDAVLAADTTDSLGRTTHVIAAQESLSAPQEYRASPERVEVRGFFEEACKLSTAYRFPLGHMVINGAFHHYYDSDTDSAFAGYRAGFNRGVNWERHQRRSSIRGTVEAEPVAVQPTQIVLP